MSTMFLIHLPISVATLVPIRNAKWLPVEIRRKKKNRMKEYKFHHNIRSKRRLWNIMSIGTFIVVFVPKGMYLKKSSSNKRVMYQMYQNLPVLFLDQPINQSVLMK
jgi:hypothetical protein